MRPYLVVIFGLKFGLKTAVHFKCIPRSRQFTDHCSHSILLPIVDSLLSGFLSASPLNRTRATVVPSKENDVGENISIVPLATTSFENRCCWSARQASNPLLVNRSRFKSR